MSEHGVTVTNAWCVSGMLLILSDKLGGSNVLASR